MRERSALVGSLVAGLLASACCIGPILLGVLGLGSLGFAAALAPYRPWFLGLTGVLLALGFHFAYRPQRTRACGPDGQCPAPASRRGQRMALWAVTVLTVGLSTFPQWSSAVQRRAAGDVERPSAANALPVELVTLEVEGMTCAACEQHVEEQLRQVPGVLSAAVSYDRHEATVRVRPPAYVHALNDAVALAIVRRRRRPAEDLPAQAPDVPTRVARGKGLTP